MARVRHAPSARARAPRCTSLAGRSPLQMPAGSGGLSDGRALGRCRPSPGHEVRRAGRLGFQFPCPRRLIVTMAPVRFGAHHVTRRCVTEVTQPRPTSAPIPHQRALRPATTTSPPSGVMSAAGRSTRAVRSGRVTGHALADWAWHRAKPRRTIWTRRGIVMAQGRLESSGERPPSWAGCAPVVPLQPGRYSGLSANRTRAHPPRDMAPRSKIPPRPAHLSANSSSVQVGGSARLTGGIARPATSPNLGSHRGSSAVYGRRSGGSGSPEKPGVATRPPEASPVRSGGHPA
jgi:hypothetical protein